MNKFKGFGKRYYSVYDVFSNAGLDIAAAALSMLIVLATMSFQTVKAAQTNPAETLKYE